MLRFRGGMAGLSFRFRGKVLIPSLLPIISHVLELEVAPHVPSHMFQVAWTGARVDSDTQSTAYQPTQPENLRKGVE